MRNLIRPTLFIVARLGLFLAIVAWIESQWWCQYLIFHGFTFIMDKMGWVLAYETTIEADQIFTTLPADSPDVFWCRAVLQTARPGWMSPTHVEIRHWLVVTIFVLCNGVLMWVYRIRKSEVVGDTNEKRASTDG